LTFSVHVRADAERDMVRAQDWYAVEAPEQVDRFADELAAATERIRARPLLFAALRQEVRRCHLNVFPHEVWYLVREELQLVEVVALVHDRQDPSRLRERLT
jgi:plasmid stabilization system protein ParE